MQVQIAALEILYLIPPHKLVSLVSAEGNFTDFLSRQMATSVKEVSAAAMVSVGRWLSETSATDALAACRDIGTTAKSWAGSIADATLDPSQTLAAAAFDASK